MEKGKICKHCKGTFYKKPNMNSSDWKRQEFCKSDCWYAYRKTNKIKMAFKPKTKFHYKSLINVSIKTLKKDLKEVKEQYQGVFDSLQASVGTRNHHKYLKQERELNHKEECILEELRLRKVKGFA